MNNLQSLTELTGLLTAAKWVIVAYAFSYMLRAFGLSLLGAQLKQRSTWTAWIPICNNYLVCRLAKSTPLLILPGLIPLLNLLVDAYLGVRMARSAGKSGMLGLLYGVPLLGNAVPVLLGLGAPAAAEEKGDSAQPPFVSALIHTGVVFCVVALIGGTAFAIGKLTPAKAPLSAQAVAAALPKSISGTLTEFPLDSAAENAATPSGVATEFYGGNAQPGGKTEKVTQEKLPPWVAPAAIPAAAQSAIAAEYTNSNAKVLVNVVALELRGQSAEAFARPSKEQLAALTPGATVSGVELKSAKNEAYRGYRVTAPEATYYALQKAGTNSAMLISATNAESKLVAERLASNIGNSNGLLEYEAYREVFTSVPPPPDAAAELKKIESYTEADINRVMLVADQASASQEMPKEIKQLYPIIRQMVPRSVTISAYEASSKAVYLSGVATYPNAAKAWTAMQAVDSLKSLAIQFIPTNAPLEYHIDTVKIGDASAILVNGKATDAAAGASGLIMRRGASIVVMVLLREGGAPVDVKPWAEKFAAAN